MTLSTIDFLWHLFIMCSVQCVMYALYRFYRLRLTVLTQPSLYLFSKPLSVPSFTCFYPLTCKFRGWMSFRGGVKDLDQKVGSGHARLKGDQENFLAESFALLHVAALRGAWGQGISAEFGDDTHLHVTAVPRLKSSFRPCMQARMQRRLQPVMRKLWPNPWSSSQGSPGGSGVSVCARGAELSSRDEAYDI
jgi:hypothetical protein